MGGVVAPEAPGTGRPAAGDAAADYRSLFVANLELIERVIRFVCHRHSLPVFEADEFAGEVKLRLVDRDYEVLRKFQHRCRLSTYLTVVINRIYLDYRNHQWGKWRPSAQAQRLGPAAVRLETLIARDGFTFDQACEHLRTNEHLGESDAELHEMFVRLPIRYGRVAVSDDGLDTMPDPSTMGDDQRSAAEREYKARRARRALTRAFEGLTDQDRIALRLRFQEGLELGEIARILHVDRRFFYRRFDALLSRLRAALEAAGIDRAEARDFVDRKDVDISLALLAGRPDPDEPGSGGPAGGSAAPVP